MTTTPTPYGLILYYSRQGAVLSMAQAVALGMESRGLPARLRTVPAVSATTQSPGPLVPDRGAPYVTLDDLAHCHALAMGSPGYFGGMASALKYFWESTGSLWRQGALIDKPAGVFCATSTAHGGNETTLWQMMAPLFHHGMVVMGLCYDEPALHTTDEGGSPYGPTHITGDTHRHPLTEGERRLCQRLGERLATFALNR